MSVAKRNRNLIARYGITLVEYAALHDAQYGVCKICMQPETMVIRGKVISLAVDHCHQTGRVRGLLCHRCNKSLGNMRDRPDLLIHAGQYLARNLT